MEWFFLLLGLFWIIFAKPLSELGVWWSPAGRYLMPASDWRIIIILMGCGACWFSVLVFLGVITLKH